MSTVIDILIFGFLISSLYALSAVGFTMIFGVAGVLNLAHGGFVVLGAFIALWAATMMGWNLYLSCALGVLGVALIAPLIYKVFVRPIQHNPILVFLLTLLLSVLIEWGLILLFSPNPRVLPPLVSGDLQLGGSRIAYNRLVASALALGTITALWLFVQRTKTGKAILALAMERIGATLVGIDAEKIQLLVWAVSGGLAALAGLFLASFLGMGPLDGRIPLVISFSIVVLGGLGSIPGSLWAAYIVGYAETIATQFAPEARGLAALLLMTLILALRPQGLLGRKHA
ncbi:MAG: branched-chain amino acid ABC transporter permease [Candidatus Bipolaricaulia bacterium]